MSWFARVLAWIYRRHEPYRPPTTPQINLYLAESDMIIAVIEVTLEPGLPLGRNVLTYSIDDGAPISIEVVTGTTFNVPIGSKLVCQNQFYDARGVTWFPSDPFTLVVPGKSPQVTLEVVDIRTIPDKLSPLRFSALSNVDSPDVPTIT